MVYRVELGIFMVSVNNRPLGDTLTMRTTWRAEGAVAQAQLRQPASFPGSDAIYLLHPRSDTPRASERRDTVWTKYVKGDTTNTKKSTDEKISTKNQD